MPSLISTVLVFCLALQPALAQSNKNRPQFDKKETLSLVQKYTTGSMSKPDLLVLLQKKYGASAEDRKFIQQIAAHNFKEIRWTLAYANNEILVRVTEPEIYNFKIASLERMYTGAKVNGKYVDFNSSLTGISDSLSDSKNTTSLFNIFFIERAEALLWFILPVAALVAVVGTLTAVAMGSDIDKTEKLFIEAKKSCDQDVSMKRNTPGTVTENHLTELAKMGYDQKSLQRYKTEGTCVEANDPQYVPKICRAMLVLNGCLSKLQVATAAPITPPQPIGTPAN